MSWRPINFDRWLGIAEAASDAARVPSSNLVAAIERMRLAWDRLQEDLDELFVPSGPPGTHAYHHYHAPADPGLRERVLNACAADYETFLVYLEVALQLSTRCVSGLAGLPLENWKTLAKAAERGDPGLAADARDQILYLQRTVLHARHKGIVHPQTHLSLVTFDNVGNVAFWRVAPEPDYGMVGDLDTLLHEVKAELRADARVGTDIPVHLALTWVGSAASQISDPSRLETLREALGYTLPGPRDVAHAVDTMVDAFIGILPETAFGRIAFAGGAAKDREHVTAQTDVSGPREPSDPSLVERLHDEAVEAARDGRYQDAIDGFQRALDLDPESGTMRLNLAKALVQNNDPGAAIEHFQAAVAIEIPLADIRADLVQAHFNAGAAAFNGENLPSAIGNYRRACELDPSDIEARRHLAVALARNGRIDAALIEIARIDQVSDEDPDAQLDAGIVLTAAGELAGARNRFERALVLRPGWNQAQRRLDELDRQRPL